MPIPNQRSVVAPLCSPFLRWLFALAISMTGFSTTSRAQDEAQALEVLRQVPAASRRHTAFVAPRRLQPRVDFWVDIFARYGKYHSVIHHRRYPQAVFAVLDFSAEADERNPVAFERYREQRIAQMNSQVMAVVVRLAQGEEAETPFEKQVYRALKALPNRSVIAALIADPTLLRSQRGIKEKYAMAISRSGKYIGEMERIFAREYGLPSELTRLPFIESSFDYRAYSSVGAAGIWQFMPRTARQFMVVNKTIDERRDPLVATRAAARYLKSAYEELGSWPLAITSYNHGVAGVARRVRAFGSTDIAELVETTRERPFGFASENFYPEFIAALEVYENHERYFPNTPLMEAVRTEKVVVPAAVSAASMAKKLGVGVESLREVNYAVSDAVWKGKLSLPRGYALKVPLGVSARTAAVTEPEIAAADAGEQAAPRSYAASYHRVRKGETLGSIAKLYRISVADLQQMNGLTGTGVRIGQQLTVTRSEGRSPVPAKGGKVPQKKASTTVYVVRSGDSLHALAKRFNTTVSKIRELNQLRSTNLAVGQKLKVPGR